MTNPQSFKAHLTTLQPHDWQKLFALLPEIERTEQFGSLAGGQETEPGVKQMPFWSSAHVAYDFVRVFYDLNLVVDFDWATWDEGERMLNDEAFDYTTLDTLTLCKLLTAIVRADRFNEGYLIANFENGNVLRLLRALRHDVENSK